MINIILDLYKRHGLPEFVEFRNCSGKFITEVIKTEAARVLMFSDNTVTCISYNLESYISLELIRGLSKTKYEGIAGKAKAALSELQDTERDRKFQTVLNDVLNQAPDIKEAIYKELQKEFGLQRLFTIE